MKHLNPSWSLILYMVTLLYVMHLTHTHTQLEQYVYM